MSERPDTMRERPDVERQLRAWLDEDGPQSVADRVVDAAIGDAIGRRRKRPLPGPILSVLEAHEILMTRSRLPMRMVWLATIIAAALLVASVLIAGSFLFHVDRMRTNGPIAFDASGDIYTYDPLHDDGPIQLTRTLDVQEVGPIFSPDGRYLAYWTTRVASSELHVRDYATGRTIVLGDADGLFLPLDAAPFGWSPDSTRVLAPARSASADETQVGIDSVIIFDVTTGEAERILVDEPTWSFGWSPDGRYVGLVSQAELLVYDVEDREVRPIRGPDPQDAWTPYWLAASPPVFTADSAAVLYTVAEDDAAGGDIWHASIAEPSNHPVMLGRWNDVAPVVVRNGTGFVFGRSAAVTVERAFNGKDGTMSENSERASDLLLVAEPAADPKTVATAVWPRASWSPDGRWLVTKSFDRELVLIDLERADQPVRVPMHEQIGGFSWGPRPP